jgi:hypothetical protein
MHFDFVATNGAFGVYTYQASGAIAETASGSDNGCPVSGKGDATHLPWGFTVPGDMGVLEIGANLEAYDATVVDTVKTYVVTTACPPPYGTSTGDVALEALGTDLGGAGFLSQKMPTTATTLAGTWGDTQYGGLWQFIADVPPK